ncbi:MAG: extracellular solute-binding protein [Bacteroidota bacterium]
MLLLHRKFVYYSSQRHGIVLGTVGRKLLMKAQIIRHSAFVVGAMLVTFVVVALFLFTPFLGQRTGRQRVTKVYFADNISPSHRVLIEQFNKIHQGKIEIVPVNLPFEKFSTNERKELLARSLRSKSDRIDVFSVDYIWVPRFAKWSEPLGNLVSEQEQNDIIEYALQPCIYQSRLVAMPLYIDIGMMYYRRDLIAKLPDGAKIEQKLRNSITWDELLQLRHRLRYAGQPFYIFQGDEYEGLVCNYFELVASINKDFFHQHGLDLNRQEAERALQFMVDLIHRYRVSPRAVVDLDENGSYAYMLDHNAVFVRGWPNFLENFRRMHPDQLKLSNIGKAALPHFSGKAAVSIFGGWNLMISKFSTKKEAAVEFIRFLQSKESQELLFEMGGYIPISRVVYEDTVFMRKHPDLSYYRVLLDHGFHRPALEEYTKVSDIISHYSHLALEGKLSVRDALHRAMEAINSDAVLLK